MTLAAILLLGISFPVSPSPPADALTQQSPQSAPEPTSGASNPQGQQETPAQPPPAEAKPSAPVAIPPKAPAAQQRIARRRRHKRKTSSNCGVAPATPGSDAAGNPGIATPPDSSSASNTGGQTEGTATAPKPCPPPKIIVRQGGSSEPSLQLGAGPNSTQASRQRDAANQLLGSTEANLKKIAGQQLSSNQQETVTQIRQFVDQSKAAVAAGDLERARTLAWKAELLSEDLVKPQK
jgi:hypothetical protein